MDRKDYVLAVLAASEGASLTPVQVQKLFFLLDRKASHLFGGPHFRFAPYDYGPFDKSVYGDLATLAAGGLVTVDGQPNLGLRTFRPTDAGLAAGKATLGTLPQDAAGYVRELSAWVRRQTFAGLVSAVYQEFPEMKANSVFKG